MQRPAAAVILIASLLTLLLIGPSLAGPFEDAVKAYESGDYKTAYRLFKQLAEKGDAHAQSKLSFLYEKGQGAPQDYAEAVKWYRTAAEKGNTLAQYNLGVLYEYGQAFRRTMLKQRSGIGRRRNKDTPPPSPLPAW